MSAGTANFLGDQGRAFLASRLFASRNILAKMDAESSRAGAKSGCGKDLISKARIVGLDASRVGSAGYLCLVSLDFFFRGLTSECLSNYFIGHL